MADSEPFGGDGMTFDLHIDLDNDAFDLDTSGELARILLAIAQSVASGSHRNGGAVRDVNGNTVGSWRIG